MYDRKLELLYQGALPGAGEGEGGEGGGSCDEGGGEMGGVEDKVDEGTTRCDPGTGGAMRRPGA